LHHEWYYYRGQVTRQQAGILVPGTLKRVALKGMDGAILLTGAEVKGLGMRSRNEWRNQEFRSCTYRLKVTKPGFREMLLESMTVNQPWQEVKVVMMPNAVSEFRAGPRGRGWCRAPAFVLHGGKR